MPDVALPFAVALGQVMPPELGPQLGLNADTPGWVATFLAGAFFVVWMADRYGALPGKPPPVRPFLTENERKEMHRMMTRVEKVHEIVVREDNRQQGWYLVWNNSEEAREMKKLLAETVQIAKNFDRMVVDNRERDQASIEALRTIQRALSEQARHLKELDDKVDWLRGRSA